MDDNRFFKLVWQFNALVIAVAALLCVTIGGYMLLHILKEATGERRVSNVVNLADDADMSDEFILGDPDRISGTDFVRVPLNREQSYRRSYYSKNSSGNTVNFLFVNTRTGQKRWLLPGTDQLIILEDVVVEEMNAAVDDSQRASAIVYSVFDSDTNNDNHLTTSDTIAIAASAPDGTNYRVLVENVESLFALEQVENDRVVAMYQKDGQTLVELYEAPAMTPLSTEPVPKLTTD